MPLESPNIDAAIEAQRAAAHDAASQVRLVAGPGTGKSSVIEKRISWLLAEGVPAAAICVVSFTRASALDLRQRVHRYCAHAGQPTGVDVRVTTLHSLALRTLRAAGLLTAYPTDPIVMDTWELENLFDAEFGLATGLGKRRREEIRREHEAFWSTGQWESPNYIPPDPPITPSERASFAAFHEPRSQTYSCVLPGEIVRKCVEHMESGGLDVVGLLGLQHLVVDEFQDLNPMDQQFIDRIVAQSANLFVGGDDDQSIYSFRFASPSGIQNFSSKFPASHSHTLASCFRCTPTILAAAQALIDRHPPQGRIAKSLVSLYATAVPPVHGIVHRWRFPSGVAEARSIAQSCRDLIAAGINPREVLILLGNEPRLLPTLRTEFDRAEVPYEPPRNETFLDSDAGRMVLGAIRIACNPDDYVAYRAILGLRPGVGVGTCSSITDTVISNNLNYKAIFRDPLPSGFTGRALAALAASRTLCERFGTWDAHATIASHIAEVAALVEEQFGSAAAGAWQEFVHPLPEGMTLAELRDFLWADTDEQQETILRTVLARLELPFPDAGVLPPRVRVMTMHGAKGLAGRVVFVPGLEEDVLPGPRRRPYPGLVLEAARLLYVSITRARAACILSLADSRLVHGRFQMQTESRFVPSLGGAFAQRENGLVEGELEAIALASSQL